MTDLPQTSAMRAHGFALGARLVHQIEQEVGPTEAAEVARGFVEAITAGLAIWADPQDAILYLMAIANTVREKVERGDATLN